MSFLDFRAGPCRPGLRLLLHIVRLLRCMLLVLPFPDALDCLLSHE